MMEKIYQPIQALFKKALPVILASAVYTANAQVALDTDKEKGSYGDPEITVNTGDACSTYDLSGNPESRTFTFGGVTLNSPTYSWSAIGGISISGSTTGASVSVAPKIDDKGRYNKGRLKVYYTGTIDSTITVTTCPVCDGPDPGPITQKIQVPKSGTAWVDIYQKFEYDDQIVGPVCVSEDDSVAYSIKDLVSGNIDDGIGIDSYFWDIDDFISIIEDGEPSYVSGDNSAYTFLFAANPAGGEQIKVTVGRCNVGDAGKQKVKTLAPKLPKAQVSGATNCIPTSASQATLTLIPVTGVKYKWVLGNANFSFAPGSGENSQPSVTVNIGKESGLIYLVSSADPESPKYCNETTVTDTIRIKRSLDGSVKIVKDTCVTPGNYSYTLSPNPNARLNWQLPPVGWSMDPDNAHAATVPVTVASNALSGTITVATEECPDETISQNVYVAPATPGLITGDTCVEKSTSKTYSISAVPNATSYTWSYPSGFTPTTGITGTSVTFNVTTNAVAGTISVVANGCAGPTSPRSIAVNFEPTRPGTITRNPSGCINRGIADTITFTAANCVAGQTYEWEVPAGWTKVAPVDKCSLTVYTNGVAGTQQKVKVYAKNNCGNSVADSIGVDVAGVGAVTISVTPLLDENDIQIGEFYIATNVSGATYQWFQDGVPIDGETTRFLSLTGSETAQICVRVTKDGCMTQTCRNSNWANSSARMASGTSAGIASSLKLYPNPASEQLNIEIKGNDTQGSYTLFNTKGSVLRKGVLNSKHEVLNTSSLEAGTYIMEVNLSGETIYKRFTISK